MRTEADENYLKEIFALEQDQGQVSTSMLAERFGYSPATVTGMLKKLAANGWVAYEPYRGVSLSDSGRAIALQVLRRHRLMETYLVKALKVPWERVHAEAERLEHSLSDYLVECIDEALGHPQYDPHGAPIPSASGQMPKEARLRLADLAVGEAALVLEVPDRDPELLQLLTRQGLVPGAQISVMATEPIDGLLTLRTPAGACTLGPTSAGRIHVKRLAAA
ncbi:MAG: DtxR family transcriptional regulator, Mn-dependent transcriptional regulator [Chloroflexota bacterium]|nr:DtxR family transcriptional regulator, Mn-dependent transcriptional regulator [Chloroflexota bacterium]